MKKYLLGIDIGTTGAKALITDDDGVVKAIAVREYRMCTPQPLWAEQDPADWWKAATKSIRAAIRNSGVAPRQVAGIGLTGQMHGLVLLDKNGKVLRPCIMWNDQRSSRECGDITASIGEKNVLRFTGNKVLAGFTAPKLVWIKRHEPGIYRKISKVLLPKDYIRYKLTGKYFSDVSDASGTSLFDVGKRRWSGEMLKALRIPEDWMPSVTESVEPSAAVSSGAAHAAGLTEGTAVAGGAGDQAAQAVGSGIVGEGVCSVTVGTSGVVFAASDKYRPEREGRLHAFCHAVPDMWHLMGVMLSAGGSFRWFRDALCGREKKLALKMKMTAYDIIAEEAAGIPAGSEGLLFLPYLSGERTPYPDPFARGAFVGLTLRHTKAHMARAVIEGITFGLRDSLELIRKSGVAVKEIRASGGGSQSALWRRMMADIFGQEISVVKVSEGAAYGAALIAGAGAGVFDSVKAACRKAVRTAGRTEPGGNTGIYEKYYARYRALYPALKTEFEKLSAAELYPSPGSRRQFNYEIQ